ncbi:MAG: phosphate/phosphite/phosphonate ABC transporter substrate-binding protein [Chloroflexota bacterium]
MRRLVLLTILLLTACSLPGREAPRATPAPATATSDLVPTATFEPPPLGSYENPILLALSPSPALDSNIVGNGQALVALLTDLTGYSVAAVSPSTTTDLLAALQVGNAHVAVLSPFAYARAYEQGSVHAAFALTRNDEASYGAQFIARVDAFKPYFDPSTGENTADAPEALAQFAGKKPCWTERTSPSGYLIPSGVLKYHGIETVVGSFLNSHFTVARNVFNRDSCEFGGTYVDALDFPALRDRYPNFRDEVAVIWRIPPIIPYDVIVFASGLPPQMASELKRAIERAWAMDDGQAMLGALYEVEGIRPVDDGFYIEFRKYLEASGADLDSLIQ